MRILLKLNIDIPQYHKFAHLMLYNCFAFKGFTTYELAGLATSTDKIGDTTTIVIFERTTNMLAIVAVQTRKDIDEEKLLYKIDEITREEDPSIELADAVVLAIEEMEKEG